MPPLTARELEVLRTVAEGHPNRDVGRLLEISEATVKKHLENIYRKLSVGNRMQAVARARALGLLS